MLAPLESLKRKDELDREELSREQMEARRLAAARELLNGVTQSQVARRYGVSRTTASRWHRSIVIKGVESLHKRRATGRPSRLTADQADAIRQMYFEGALAHGFSTNRWTTSKLAVAIEQRFGIHYDQDHVGRLMHKLGLRERRFVYAPAVSAPGMQREIGASATT